MKQRFLNQKLGKRMSRKVELLKAKRFAAASKPLRAMRSTPAGAAPPAKEG